jgi:hypothetical protein
MQKEYCIVYCFKSRILVLIITVLFLRYEIMVVPPYFPSYACEYFFGAYKLTTSSANPAANNGVCG